MKPALLLLNLGSPKDCSVDAVRSYLAEFLDDERVLDIPAWKRKIILNCFILPKRPKESAEAYRSIWTDEGSPLIVTSRQQQDLLTQALDIPIYLAMRYGQPATATVVQSIVEAGITDLFLMPLYPHYAMSSYETAIVKAQEAIAQYKPELKTKLLMPYYADEDFIQALSQSILPHLKPDAHLLWSYHGIPERQIRKTDPSHAHCLTNPHCCDIQHPSHATCYRHQCLETTKACLKKLPIGENTTSVAFQSRLLRDPWLGPYTDFELRRLAKEGVKHIQVVCPSFVSDCLETLEEIGIRGAEEFLSHGGESLELIPCLNAHPLWIDFLAKRAKAWLKELAS